MTPRRSLIRGSLAVLLAALAGCGPETPAPVAPPAPAPVPPVPATTAEPAPKSARPAYEDPGGMWMPEQLGRQAETLKSLGLEIDPAALGDPTSPVLGAVVSLGGCSASFLSDDGLVITNHHCSIPALQLNSTPKENLLRDGYLAKTRADERWAGSSGLSSRVFVTQSLRDVTRDVTDGLAAIKDDIARYRRVEERQKELVAACEKGRPWLRCSVAEYFGGAQYRLIEQLEIKDVRLVFAPHEAIGNYGGEVDNWRWPRHTGDVAIFRAYVGKDGKPAEHSADNVPYHPPHHLKLASKPLAAGDLVFVAGYPGTTNRLRTAAEAEEATSFTYPHQIEWCDENIALFDQLRAKSDDVKIKVTPMWRRLSNARTKWNGIVDGMVKGGLGAQKAKGDADLRAFIAGDPARQAAYGDVLDKIKALVDGHKATRAHDAELGEMNRLVSLYGAAATIVRMAEERAKPDAERDPAYQERNWQRLAQAQQTLQKSYDRTVDQALLKLAIQRALRLPEKERPELVAALLGKGAVTDARIDKALDELYKKTGIEDEKARIKLLDTAKTADLKKSKDPLIKLALTLRPAHKAAEDREKAASGEMLLLRPRYVEALQKMDTHPLAPDANGTLRITFGTVRGYRPTPEAVEFRPFTLLSEMVKKKGAWPFDVPDYALDTVKAGKFGPYVDAALGEVPVDFLSDLDITGGNSGSPTLNSRGEIVGLAFDGNYESMASDWLFQPSITRTIQVDIRYVEWLLDAVYPGHHILEEMGGKPSFN
jgi:Peptidase S46